MSKKRIKYTPIDKLTPWALPDQLEDELRKLYSLACQNSKPLWDALGANGAEITQEVRHEFISLVHLGMRQAQHFMLHNLLNDQDNKLHDVRVFAYRGIADSMAWQLLMKELAYAKRFFQAVQPPKLDSSNIQSVIAVTEKLHEEEPDSIALISDLTSFIQVGDIIHMSHKYKMKVYEVKEGEVNQQILETLKKLTVDPDERLYEQLVGSQSTSFKKQFERTLRQKARMQTVQDTLKNDKGVDFSSGLEIKIVTAPFSVGTWYPALIEAYEQCKSRGWGIAVDQGCLFLGCYDSKSLKLPGQIVFEGWFSGMGATEDCPRTSLVNSMLDPLALPIYSLPLPDELKFDLLFGRKHVAMGISVQRLIAECKKFGVVIDSASQKTTTQLAQKNNFFWKYNGRALILSTKNKQITLGEGFALRVFFHGESPVDAMMAMALCE